MEMLSFFNIEILPKIPFVCPVVWGFTSAANLERILRLQKRFARIIVHSDYNTPSAKMFKEPDWLPITKR